MKHVNKTVIKVFELCRGVENQEYESEFVQARMGERWEYFQNFQTRASKFKDSVMVTLYQRTRLLQPLQ